MRYGIGLHKQMLISRTVGFGVFLFGFFFLNSYLMISWDNEHHTYRNQLHRISLMSAQERH